MNSVPFEAVWAGPDKLRAQLYRWASPLLRSLYAQRERRVFWLAMFTVASSLVLTVLAPLWLLALGPVVLGVPHLLADLRYLVVQPGLHRRRALWFAALPLAGFAIGAPAAVGLWSVLLAVLVARAGLLRKCLMFLPIFALCGWAASDDNSFTLVFVHAHNLIALVVWGWLRGGRASTTLAMVLATLAGAIGLLLGLADPVISELHAWFAPASGASFDDFIAANAPFADGRLATHVVLSFAFLQSVHYGLWLRLVPDDQRKRAAPRPFRASWRALVADFGLVPMLLVTALALSIATWGAFDLASARLGYLKIASFHGTLELAVLALLFTERGRPAATP